ncbi:MAG: ABC transporter ATP-binding protein [Armatimonadota bacterium]|nr:ABC transporter ATP-binding protein [Armatimonadota bacterium]MDR7452673.1 ABC transporter ATP-binding protein [Armatimonadota bacterium]MDR7467729.1 ABC transporter ATP-binding protein [Armatimonadota bacterium]MDR7499806.1 ABC transporter ATP-binding protein [Armatimonadota bacterium]MDR7505248.1 ABC transporter ATP-binding protein [Armatimonadota bacterium]
MDALVEMRGITKVYPNGVVANDRVDFAVRAGEIHGLVGENGAGKTTLMKLLYGLEQPTDGEIRLRGRPVAIRNPHAAIALGIGMVHQNFMLVPNFTVAENIVLGLEPQRRGLVDRRRALAVAEDLARRYGLQVTAGARIDEIPVGMRQRVEILKALYRGAEILILDEPTAVLTPQETADLFRAVRSLVAQGKTVIFISHKLREMKAVADRVTVMRDGRVMGTLPVAEATEETLAQMMVGRRVLLQVARPPGKPGPVVLAVRDLEYVTETGHRALRGVSFAVRAGEIFGIAGVEGNGQTELVEILTGLRTASGGTVFLDGQVVVNRSPRRVRQAGMSHVPEDRLRNGVAPPASIAENLIVDRYFAPPFTRYRWYMDSAAVKRTAEQLMAEFDIRAPDGAVPVRALSGGNMQKVVLARELSRRPKVLVAAQPTRGIDIGATEFAHRQLVRIRDGGAAVLLVSADLSEVMALSDRLAVMHNGEIAAVFDEPGGLTEEEVGLYMLGLKKQDQSTAPGPQAAR